MSIENLYGYLEYLSLAIDQLEEIVVSREHEANMLADQLDVTDQTLLAARGEIDRLHAQMHINMQQAEAHIKHLEGQIALQAEALMAEPAPLAPVVAAVQKPVTTPAPANTTKQKKAKPQNDLFSGWTATPQNTQNNSIANDQSAMILAKKLDSTIDKVQRLIGQGR